MNNKIKQFLRFQNASRSRRWVRRNRRIWPNPIGQRSFERRWNNVQGRFFQLSLSFDSYIRWFDSFSILSVDDLTFISSFIRFFSILVFYLNLKFDFFHLILSFDSFIWFLCWMFLGFDRRWVWRERRLSRTKRNDGNWGRRSQEKHLP